MRSALLPWLGDSPGWAVTPRHAQWPLWAQRQWGRGSPHHVPTAVSSALSPLLKWNKMYWQGLIGVNKPWRDTGSRWLRQGQKEPIGDETLPPWIRPSPNPICRYNSFTILWFCFWFHFNIGLVTSYCIMIIIRIVKITNILFVILRQPHRI